LKIVLDQGPTLEYKFESKDKLTLSEGGAAVVSAPYSAKELDDIILFTHMIPNTVRGYGIVYDTKTSLVTAFELWFGGFEPDKREVWRHFMPFVVYKGLLRKTPCANKPTEVKARIGMNDNGVEMLLFFFGRLVFLCELSDPMGGITITAPSDYIKINDRLYIYSRVEQEYSGTLTLEVIDLFTVSISGCVWDLIRTTPWTTVCILG
jgi:hypothetical protein